jgi:hypothetical protein
MGYPRSYCKWCGHQKIDHTGLVDVWRRKKFPTVRWLKTACNLDGCMCRKYEAPRRHR